MTFHRKQKKKWKDNTVIDQDSKMSSELRNDLSNFEWRLSLMEEQSALEIVNTDSVGQEMQDTQKLSLAARTARESSTGEPVTKYARQRKSKLGTYDAPEE